MVLVYLISLGVITFVGEYAFPERLLVSLGLTVVVILLLTFLGEFLGNAYYLFGRREKELISLIEKRPLRVLCRVIIMDFHFVGLNLILALLVNFFTGIGYFERFKFSWLLTGGLLFLIVIVRGIYYFVQRHTYEVIWVIMWLGLNSSIIFFILNNPELIVSFIDYLNVFGNYGRAVLSVALAGGLLLATIIRI